MSASKPCTLFKPDLLFHSIEIKMWHSLLLRYTDPEQNLVNVSHDPPSYTD
jgi:hypothetical protein